MWLQTWHICSVKSSGDMYVQGDSGRKVSILGGDSIVHCQKKVYMIMFLISGGYWDGTVWICKYKSIVNGNNEGKIQYC